MAKLKAILFFYSLSTTTYRNCHKTSIRNTPPFALKPLHLYLSNFSCSFPSYTFPTNVSNLSLFLGSLLSTPPPHILLDSSIPSLHPFLPTKHLSLVPEVTLPSNFSYSLALVINLSRSHFLSVKSSVITPFPRPTIF